jgi:hypothetical protein
MTDVHNFIGSRIAILRPSARTYYFLDWQTSGVGHNLWNAVTEDIPEAQLQHGQHATLDLKNVRLNVRMLRGTRSKELRGRVSGHFVKRTQPDGSIQYYAIVKLNPYNLLPTWCTHSVYRTINHYGSPVIETPQLYTTSMPITQPNTTQPKKETPKLSAIPKRIARLVAIDYINNGEECPITMMPLDVDTTAVTSCYHVFEKAALDEWMKSSTSCPVCKSECVVTGCV